MHLLLLVTIFELAFNRLATRELKPLGGADPPWWHQALDHLGLFTQYFASTLAIGILGFYLWRLVSRRELYWSGVRVSLALLAIPFLGLACLSIARSLGVEASFWLESCFTAMVLLLLLGQLTRRGDIGVKIGLAFLAAPLLIHYYGPFSLRFLDGEEALWSDLPERVRQVGQWALVAAAMASPYCLSPRPFTSSAARLGPVVVATLVSVVGVVIVRQHYEVGMRLANYGLGVELGPGAPARDLAIYVLALGTIAWTLTSCLTADSVSRRELGVGLGLVVAGGYGFAWPLQYLVSLVGLMTIAESAAKVPEEERAARQPTGVRGPPIADAIWQRYVEALVRALDGEKAQTEAGVESPPEVEAEADTQAETPAETPTEPGNKASMAAAPQEPRPWSGSTRGSKASVATVRQDGDTAITHVVAQRRNIDIAIRIERHNQSVTMLEVTCGEAAGGAIEPAWTLYARPERLLGIGSHPEPPAAVAPVVKSSDSPFDQRFRIRDAGGVTATLLDDSRRARATALIDGWVAFWPGYGLRYCVYPGQGAPLDHPIPVTELAFRGEPAASTVDRLVRMVDLLAEITSAGLGAHSSSGNHAS